MTFVDQLAVSIAELARDREQVTPEIHAPNDYYGHATALKKYAGLPADYALKLYIQHGVRFDLSYWRHDYRKDHRIGLVHSPWRVEVLREQIPKKLYAIGPYLHYAEPLFSREEIAGCREQLGRTLLVFPAHSTQWIDTNYDLDAFAERLRDEQRRFQTVLVCLYWKDVLRGAREQYGERGFRCVTAGHLADREFLPRFRALIEIADATMSNQLGTHLGYSLHLGKPHQLVRMEITQRAESADRASESTAKTRLDVDLFHELFAAPPERITDDQRALAEKYWGFGSIKTPGEMRSIIDEAERLQRSGRSLRTRLAKALSFRAK